MQNQIEMDRDEKEGNTKKPLSQAYQYSHLAFTFNNYKNRDIEMLKAVFDEKCYKYVFQEEIGAEGTPHLQGTISPHKRARWTEFGLSKKIHWEYPVKDVAASYDYCCDINKRKPGGKVISKNHKWEEEIKIELDYNDWQKEIISMIQLKAHKRNIYWYYGEQGAGKTQLQKYLIKNHGAILLSGKPSDMKNGIIEYQKTNKRLPKIILSNIGFDKDLAKIHYSGYEDIKDMCFYSGKYEGGMVCGENPHLIIFANGKAYTKNKKFINRETNNNNYYRDKLLKELLNRFEKKEKVVTESRQDKFYIRYCV